MIHSEGQSNRRRGQNTTEYAIILGLMLLLGVGAGTLGRRVAGVLTSVRWSSGAAAVTATVTNEVQTAAAAQPGSGSTPADEAQSEGAHVLGRATTSTGTTYHVDATDGRDSNDGRSPITAWRTITRVNASHFQPGDSILFRRGAVWRQKLAITSSGSHGTPITFGAYGTGGPPILSGADLISHWSSAGNHLWSAVCQAQPGMVFFNGTPGTRREGLPQLTSLQQWYWGSGSLTVYSSGEPGITYNAPGIEASTRDCCVAIDGRVNQIAVKQLALEKAGNGQGWGAGMRVIDNCSNVTVSDIVARLNSRYGIYVSASSAITINSCQTHDNGMQGIQFYDNSSGCSVTDSDSSHNGENGIAIETGSNNVRIERTSIHDNGDEGTDLDSCGDISITQSTFFRNGRTHPDTEGHGVNLNGSINGRVDISYCLFYQNPSFGVSIWDSYKTAVLNCTFYANGRALNVAHGSLKVANCIMTESAWGPEVSIIDGLSGVSIDYNLYFRSKGTEWRLGDSAFNSMTNWRAASGQDMHSLTVDPQFAGLGDTSFPLQGTSPCVGAGEDVGLSVDYAGVAVPGGARPDLGAREYRHPPG